MDFMFAPHEAVWLLALIYQPVVLIYYIINDQARKIEISIKPKSKKYRSVAQIFSLSLSGFTLVVLSKILLMNVYGIESLVFMLGALILMTAVATAYITSFFSTLNAKKLIFFSAFVIGAVITYTLIIPSGLPLEQIYNDEFAEFITPLMFPGLIGFTAFAIVALTLYILKKTGKGTRLVQKMSQPLWDKRKATQKIFGFYFHLIIWIFLVLETFLNQAGYTILSWGIF